MRKYPIFLFFILFFTFGFFGTKGTSQKLQSSWIELEKDTMVPTAALPSLAPIIEKAAPAVLLVKVEGVAPAEAYPDDFGPFGELFPFFQAPPNLPKQERKVKGQGSGFIIHPSGLALTNYHVVENAKLIKVKVGGQNTEYTAEIIGSDPDTDMALIQIKNNKADWPALPLGSSEEIRVGDYVIALGSPLGLELTASNGIISAKSRSEIFPSGKAGYFNFLQTTAPINPGNSGGPLVNLRGEVIGMNTAMANAQGIGFAIPSNMIKDLLPQLKNGKVSHSFLGVMIDEVTAEVGKAMGLKPEMGGALVRQIVAGGPAEKAGILAGDIITEFDGKPVRNGTSLKVMAGLAGVGKTVPVQILRKGKYLKLTVTLEVLPNQAASNLSEKENKNTKSAKLEGLGITIAPLTPAERKKLKLTPKAQGVLIAFVERGSLAYANQLKVGDLIIELNGQSISSVGQILNLYKNIPQGGVLQMYVLRASGGTLFMAIPKP